MTGPVTLKHRKLPALKASSLRQGAEGFWRAHALPAVKCWCFYGSDEYFSSWGNYMILNETECSSAPLKNAEALKDVWRKNKHLHFCSFCSSLSFLNKLGHFQVFFSPVEFMGETHLKHVHCSLITPAGSGKGRSEAMWPLLVWLTELYVTGSSLIFSSLFLSPFVSIVLVLSWVSRHSGIYT